jgi:hypothetical protein
MFTIHGKKTGITDEELREKVITAFLPSMLLRRYEMVKLVIKNPEKYSIADLAEKYRVCEKVIICDMKLLRDSGIEIRNCDGKVTVFNLKMRTTKKIKNSKL